MVNDLESRLASPEEGSELERTVKKEEEKSDWKLRTILWDTIKYSPLGAIAYLLGGPASLLAPIGLGLGRLIANKKKKKKTTWNEMRKVLAVGNFTGVVGYWAYSIPDFIIGAPVSFLGKIAKTLLFNPLMVIPFLGWYKATSYIVDKHGGPGLIKSLFKPKTFKKYLKEAYDEDLKKKYLPTLAETFLTLSPIHFFSMNYVANPTYRVGIGAINDILFSMIIGEEGALKTIARKFKGKKKENKYAAPSPTYAPTTPAYKPA